MSTTSLKLPEDVKKLAAEAAKTRGITPHAFMVSAIRDAATAAAQRAEFMAEALAAESETLASGTGFDAAEVHDYLRARASGDTAERPKAKTWRD
ncbi:MAG: hypothetical protein H6981_14995 [Gammaproteobacteria bacterium]|nr:hypothetical protein [Gammaproteobacteria bacterium]MCP5138092.1 hypothetical protein [Gammaproteobacteria bacterium]